MANLYKVTFTGVEKEYATKKYVSKKGVEEKLYLDDEDSITILEEELSKYWKFGGGIVKAIRVGQINDKYLSPTISEQEFVNEQIKSKKNGSTIGYQG